MQRWTASLTLVAYLIGGWVLPTMHHHGTGTATALHVQAECHGHAHQGEPSSHEEHPSGCSHSHESVQDPDAAAQNALPSSGSGLTGSDIDDCHGLCALCVARTLCSQQLPKSDVVVGTAFVEGTIPAQPRIVLQRARGNVSSRGPPLFV